MSDLRECVEQLRKLYERRAPRERDAAQLAKLVFKKLTLARAQYNRTGEYKAVLKEPLPGMAYAELNLRYDPDIEPHVPADEPWHHRGQAGWTRDGQTAIRVTYRLAHPAIDKWMLEPLSHDIAGVLRHELEHHAQGKAASYAKSPGDDWGDLTKTRAYLLNPREIEAFATQAYTQAKRQKTPVTVPIERKVDRLEKALRRRGVDKQAIQSLSSEYRKAVTDYLVKRYPTAQFQTRRGETVLARNLQGQWW